VGRHHCLSAWSAALSQKWIKAIALNPPIAIFKRAWMAMALGEKGYADATSRHD